ncbi:flagellar motor switch protein FliG [Escherichia coli]|uniref:Flagellar motor switch protein FliG n=1 Tax=Escherichia coli TaxID=562 RepID=A0A376SAP0_ECOLX|nr:flagellar motor switch protein FliG [Escherichia coli]
MSNLTGTDKSVILLMTIGEDRAAEVFKHLSQREVQTLSAAMANVTQISNKQLTDVLAEFEQEAETVCRTEYQRQRLSAFGIGQSSG